MTEKKKNLQGSGFPKTHQLSEQQNQSYKRGHVKHQTGIPGHCCLPEKAGTLTVLEALA